ncbi:MAG TPA: hypothetical protein PLS46_20035 [Microthrixaceae bacterium]|nr:hypothetical protein [Microthrixaceae bacterium]
MTNPDIRERFARYLAEQSNRGLGSIPLAPTRALAPISRGLMAGATNLLTKALRALEADDEARARQFVERAAALPYDDHEERHPGVAMAQQELFTEIVDILEDCEDHWVAAVADVFAAAQEQARFALRDVLNDILQDFSLTDDEQRRVRHLIRDIPQRAELCDLDLDLQARASAIFEILEAVIIFRDGLDEIHALEDDEE